LKLTCKLYLDESGNLADNLPCTLVATFNSDKRTRKKLSRIPKRVRQRTMEDKLKNVPELKFYDSSESIRERFLEYVAKYEPEAYALTLDKEGRRVDDTPYNYAIMVGRLLTSVVSEKEEASFDLYVDKKYTNPKEREEFNTTLRWLLDPLGVKISCKHLGGEEENLIQVADFLAGAFLRRDAFGEDRYYDIIAGVVRKEKEVRWTSVKAAVEKRKREER